MIGTIDVKVQAHNPNFPLEPVFTFINSAQSFRIRNVPRAIGKWNITKVFIHLNYPDNTTVQKECVLNGNIWIGTVEGCATSGTSTNGFYVTASGIDENENVITNYVLGAGDLYVKDLDGTIEPAHNGEKMYFNDTLPTNPKKGDATFIDGVLNVYDGTNWTPVADDPDLSNYYTKTEVDEALGEVEESIPTKTSDLSNDSGFVTTEEVKPFYKFDTSTGTSKPTEMACYSVILAGMYKANNRADKYAEVQPLVEFDPVELTPKFTLRALYLGYHPWKLSKFFEQTYSPELELVWWNGPICRVVGGHFVQSYTGFMWRTKGVGFAIPCDENGIPNGRLYEISVIEQTSPYRIGYNNTTQIHTITGNENWSAILTIDEQENQITCTRSITNRAKESKQTFPTLDDIPTSTSQLTNDSGFITGASYIEDATGNKISANLSCTYIDDTAWEMTDPSSNKHILEYVGFIHSYHTWECVEPENIKLVLTYANDWELQVYTWQEIGPGGDHDWVLDINASYDGDSDITTIPYFVNAQTTYNYSAQRPVTKHMTLATKEYVDSLFAQLNARISALENNNQ